jgi:hypothetical protein
MYYSYEQYKEAYERGKITKEEFESWLKGYSKSNALKTERLKFLNKNGRLPIMNEDVK